MSGCRGPAVTPAWCGWLAVAASALVFVGGCGGRRRVTPEGDASAPVLAFVPSATMPAPFDAARMVDRLDAVRTALRDGRTEEAGRLLGAALRDVERALRARDPFDPSVAATFEAVRRVADRWQAGVPSRSGDGEAIVDRLESASLLLLEGDDATR